jgi:magnesium chelatase subunit I
MVFTANPEDYTARGKIITPLKDRIGSEIRTHYPTSRQDAIAITAQEAWVDRACSNGGPGCDVPRYVREVVEEIAFLARADSKVDKRSGVSQRLPITCLENTVSNAERRAILAGEPVIVPRVTDVYAALSSITGKFELEYEGELRGAEVVGRELIRGAVANVFTGYFGGAELHPVVEWFDLGGTLQLADTSPAGEVLARAREIQGLVELTGQLGLDDAAPAAVLASAVDFVLEGLYAQRKISRTDDWRYHATDEPRRPARSPEVAQGMTAQGKKKYYN